MEDKGRTGQTTDCPAPRPSEGLLVLGYGNTLRSDDGVGPKVAEAVAALNLPGVRALACGLLTPELADPIAQAARVIFVDAAVDAPREVQLRPLAPADSSQIMAHAANPRTLLALARDVFGHAPPAWWLTIPVENLGIGEDFSLLAERGFATALETIRTAALPIQDSAFVMPGKAPLVQEKPGPSPGPHPGRY
jgi:hydrogenase maturation protease